MNDPLIDDLRRDEGTKLKPYYDSLGILSIGTGRNLQDRGISQDEADFMLMNDIADTRADLTGHFCWYRNMSPVRKRALENMRFQLGMTRLLGFVNMLIALENGNYKEASAEALSSRWASQCPDRAQRIADAFTKG